MFDERDYQHQPLFQETSRLSRVCRGHSTCTGDSICIERKQPQDLISYLLVLYVLSRFSGRFYIMKALPLATLTLVSRVLGVLSSSTSGSTNSYSSVTTDSSSSETGKVFGLFSGETLSISTSSAQAPEKTIASERVNTTQDEESSSETLSMTTSVVSASGQPTASGDGSTELDGESSSEAFSVSTSSVPTPDQTETPEGKNSTPPDGGPSGNATSGGYRNALYFTNWCVHLARFLI